MSIDTHLSEILDRHIVHRKSTEKPLMLCKGELIEYNPQFRLYITTNLTNPHYPPTITSKITLIDFTLTATGLEQKLLSAIICEERAELREHKENHIVEKTKNSDLLYKLESNILDVLSSCEGNILEDENAITILSTSKSMSEEIQVKQQAAIAVERSIDEQYREYVVVAQHATLLYGCIMKLASINSVYQFSLVWFVELYTRNIRETQKSEQTLGERLGHLNECFTKRIFKETTQLLYVKDQLAFLFLVWIEQMRVRETWTNDEELAYLLRDKENRVVWFAEKQEEILDEGFSWMPRESKDLMNELCKLPR